jgi:hypothetical protein
MPPLTRINFNAPAEVYCGCRAGLGFFRGMLTFHCFPTLAEAIRFAVEELPQDGLGARRRKHTLRGMRSDTSTGARPIR